MCDLHTLEPIRFLSHQSKHWIDILKNGNILNQYELVCAGLGRRDGFCSGGNWNSGGQFIGVYMGLLTDQYLRIIERDSPTFIFSPCELLSREDYHINEFDNNGIITTKSWSRKNISIFISKIRDGQIKLYDPEVVFHNRVNFNNLMYIVCPDNIYEKIKSKMYSENLSEWIDYLKPLKIIHKEYFSNYLDLSTLPPYSSKLTYLNYPPRFCGVQTSLTRDIPNRINSLSVYEQIAMNCGMTENDLIDFLDKNCRGSVKYLCLEKLRRYIFDNYEVPIIAGTKKIPETIFYPPFNENDISDILMYANRELSLID